MSSCGIFVVCAETDLSKAQVRRPSVPEAATLEKTEQIHGLATGGFGTRSRRPAERTG